MTEVVGSIKITDPERYALTLAIGDNCGCSPERPDMICPAHAMLKDENVLKHLLFARRVADAYVLGEFEVKAKQ